jgi:Fe-S oxidoreductase
VILWPDTFNNYFHPEVAKAAVEVLEAANFQVLVPEPSLCCGRPLYDFGMVATAKRLLKDILNTLRPWIADGVPIVGLEPSCLAVFRDELVNLFPADEDAERLAQQTFLLSEFLNRNAADRPLPPLHRKALVHGHCHHKAIMKMTDEEEVLNKLGLEAQVLDSGCCGMAGSFGFEKEHYDVSQAVGELVLLPAVRQASTDTLIIADGFSCIEQVRQATNRRPLHLAQVIQMALHEGPAGPSGPFPESRYPMAQPKEDSFSATALLLGAGAAVLAGFWLGRQTKRRRAHARETAERNAREDLRPHLRHGRPGYEELARLCPQPPAGGQSLHGDRRLP